MHDTSSDSGLDVAGKRKFKTYEEVGIRIDGLVDYLLAQDAVYADKKQVVITDQKVVGAPVVISEEDQTSRFTLSLVLNNSGSGYEDHINITVTAGDTEVVVPVVYGKQEYSIEITAKQGQAIKAVVSAMFMKQSTSGMFWFSEEVDEATVDATIACLKANNPSYKGHNAICFGEGAHELEFKKGKFATYIFGEDVSIEESGEEIVESTEETGTTDETVTDTTDSKEAEKEAKKNSK